MNNCRMSHPVVRSKIRSEQYFDEIDQSQRRIVNGQRPIRCAHLQQQAPACVYRRRICDLDMPKYT
jgi:hypothetical protein